MRFPWFSAAAAAGRAGASFEGERTAQLGHRVERAGRDSDGIFAEWSWDGDELIARNDRYGIFPIYYSGDANHITISVSPIQLIAQGVSAELNHDALALLFRLGRMVGDDTPFAEIHLLAPGAVLRWRPGLLSVDCQSPIPPAMSDLDAGAAVATFAELFTEAIARRSVPDDRLAVPLSGGRDSRHILIELCRQGRVPEFVMTHGFSPARAGDDVTIARALSRRLAIPHLIVTKPFARPEALTLYNVLVNMSAPVSAPFLHTDLLALQGRGVGVVYEGLGGDAIAGPHYLEPTIEEAFKSGRLDDVGDLLLRRWGPEEQSLRRILPGSMNLDAARAKLRPVVEASMDAANPQMWFHFWTRTRRMISPGHLALAQGIRTVFVPFLDHELVDFLLALPVGVHRDGSFHDRTIAASYPDFADIPFAVAGNRPPSGQRIRTIAGLSHFMLRRAPRATPRLARWLGRRARGGPLSPSVEALHYLGQLEALSRPGEAARELGLALQLETYFGQSLGTMVAPGQSLPT